MTISAAPLTTALAERLNDQYWNSVRTIDEIVGTEGVSRNRLYESVRPYSTAQRCPACGEALVFPNRRSKGAGTALCPACRTEANLEQTLAPESSDTSGALVSYVGDIHGLSVVSNGWQLKDRKKAIIGGAAALGVMLGAVATRVINHGETYSPEGRRR